MKSCKTLGAKEKPFNWEYSDNRGITIYRTFSSGSEVMTVFSNVDVQSMVDRFIDAEEISLANNVQKLRDGTEIDGLGSFAYDSLGKSTTDAQAVSQLAAIFVEVGLFSVNRATRNMKFKFTTEAWQEHFKRATTLLEMQTRDLQIDKSRLPSVYACPKSKGDYLSSPVVEAFAEWLVHAVDDPSGFYHRYISKKTNKPWSCQSVYEAYLKYEWAFSCAVTDGRILRGSTYQESSQVLSYLRLQLRSAMMEKQEELLKSAAISVLDWGGVKPRNEATIMQLDDFVGYCERICKLLSSGDLSLAEDFSEVYMNSGWTKIYSLLVDDFVIYDGRVGAALGLLVRLFLRENGLLTIPPELSFHYGSGKGDNSVLDRRDPSDETYVFDSFVSKPNVHLMDNIKANWLLGEVYRKSRFNAEREGLRKLEAALFMIGYDVSQRSSTEV